MNRTYLSCRRGGARILFMAIKQKIDPDTDNHADLGIKNRFLQRILAKNYPSDRTIDLLNPIYLARGLWKHRFLIIEMTRREINQQYQGSFFGIIWSFVVPLCMLLIYTFIFTMVFKSRWQGAAETPPGQFAIILFTAFSAFNVFTAILGRAPTLVTNNPSYVKKVVFPLEILPVTVLGANLFISLVNIVLVILGNLILTHTLSATLVFLPIVYLPLIFLCLGIGWFLASLGVYLRDINQVIPILSQVLFFVTPMFYSIESVPPLFQKILLLNPLTTIVTSFRQVILWNTNPFSIEWLALFFVTAVLAQLGYVWFMKSKKGFADVL